MKSIARGRARLATLLLLLLALARPLRVAGEQPVVGNAWLPELLDGDVARVVPLQASEARLDRRPNVAVSKRRYGETLSTAVSVLGGVREHHPASVCLRASGLEIVSKREERRAEDCVAVLRVRRGAKEAVVATTYLAPGHEATCSLGRRIAAGAWERLWGQRSTWTHLQVLDSKPQRALVRLQLLIDAMRRRKSQ